MLVAGCPILAMDQLACPWQRASEAAADDRIYSVVVIMALQLVLRWVIAVLVLPTEAVVSDTQSDQRTEHARAFIWGLVNFCGRPDQTSRAPQGAA